jgi:DMSO/TMAO reductase YedYZ molybdopterin-dependent catalytic subunit
VVSLQRGGAFGQAALQANQIAHPDALLALCVDCADLTRDYGYPARIIVSALPGVHHTKWVGAIDFEAG